MCRGSLLPRKLPEPHKVALPSLRSRDDDDDAAKGSTPPPQVQDWKSRLLAVLSRTVYAVLELLVLRYKEASCPSHPTCCLCS